MADELPSLILTGASGIVGPGFLAAESEHPLEAIVTRLNAFYQPAPPQSSRAPGRLLQGGR